MASRFDSFRIRLTLLFGGLSLVLGLALSLAIDRLASARMTEASAMLLQGFAQVTANAISENLRQRGREGELPAPAPRADAAGKRREVAASHLHGLWMGDIIAAVLPQGAREEGIEAFVVDAREEIIYPDTALGRPRMSAAGEPARLDWADGHGYLSSVVAIKTPTNFGLGWRVVVRQPVARALAPVEALHHALKFMGLVALALLMTLAYWLAVGLSRPIEQLADLAHRIEQGDEETPLTVQTSVQELLRLIHSLRGMTATLIRRRQELQGANASLEEKVAVRTAELHRANLVLTEKAAEIADLYEQLRDQEVLSHNIIHASPNGLLLYHRDGHCLLANEAAADIVGASMAEMLQQNFHHIQSWKSSGLYAGAQAALAGQQNQIMVSTTSTFGRQMDCIMTLLSLRHGDDTLLLVVMKNVSDLVAANRQLEQLARHDVLTGLENRLAANERLRDEFLRLKRTGSVYAVLLMDVDHFKQVNDSHGHAVGDLVLQHIAQRITASARATDFSARFGGEEFIMLLPDTDLAGAAVVAEKIRTAVADSQPPVISQVSLSVGVSVASDENSNEHEAVRLADQALYRAKAQGRNRVVLMHQPVA